jgi:acyl-CoA dehydrogenase
VLGRLGVVRQRLYQGRAALEQSRLLVLACAKSLDVDAETPTAGSRSGVKSQRTLQLVALIKAAVPSACERVIDGCLQLFGGEGVSQDQPLARAFVAARSLRLADGPDEVHEVVVARLELKAAALRRSKRKQTNGEQKSVLQSRL